MLDNFFATCGQPKHKVSVGPRMESLEIKHIAYLLLTELYVWDEMQIMMITTVILIYLMMYFAHYVVIMMTMTTMMMMYLH